MDDIYAVERPVLITRHNRAIMGIMFNKPMKNGQPISGTDN
jgi:hypothetical protein